MTDRSTIGFGTARSGIGRYAAALGIVTAATILRAAVDPLIHDQTPYPIYLASIVVTTWFCGTGAGLLNTIVAAFAGNYFFVQPRYVLRFNPDDYLAMAVFSAVSVGLVWLVGRWRRAELLARELHSASRQRAEELETTFDTVPAAVWVTRDRDARHIDGNRYGAEVLQMPMRANLSKTAPPGEAPTGFRVVKDEKEVPAGELPIQVAAARGIVVRDYEFEVVYDDGTTRTFFGNASPLRDDTGEARGAVGVFVEVTERRRVEAELQRREEQLRSATLAAEVGVWTWTPSSNHVSVGANWRGLFGVPADADVTFDTWANALHPDDRQRAIDTLNVAWRDRCDFVSEYRVVCPDGTTRWIIDRGRATHDSRGNVVGMAGINIDITERRQAEQSLRDANRLKDEFLATLSHELRTPLNAIVGWADMLRRGSLKPVEAQRAIESIYRNAKVQNELINDVLDVSRIISGKVVIETQPVDPAALLHNAVESVRAAADAKNVKITTDVASVPSPIRGDSTRLQQVFWNLLSNAVKFTPSGGRVWVSARVADGQVWVKVSDTGIGISADFLPHVFERFRQHDSSSTRTQSGLGLGLAIARHLVELHGGTVKAESAGEGKGATFTVSLPAQPFEERRREERPVVRQVPPVEEVPNDLPTLCGCRVLVVDDERDAREVAASVLRHHGASVAIAASGAQALDQFALFDPNVVLMDLAMPDMDGYGLIERIRRSNGQKGAKVPAIAFTAYAREEDQRRALAKGFQLHLAKPVDSHTLVRAIAAVRREAGSKLA